MNAYDTTKVAKNALEESLLAERAKLRGEIAQLREAIQEKERDARAKEQRLAHVDALLATEQPSVVDQAHRRQRAKSASTPTEQLLNLAVTVLRERKGEPMHYRDLADELMRRGAVIRGQDPASALVSRMTQDDNRRAEADRRFIRPTSKGFYALREEYPDARNVGARRRNRGTGQARAE